MVESQIVDKFGPELECLEEYQPGYWESARFDRIECNSRSQSSGKYGVNIILTAYFDFCQLYDNALESLPPEIGALQKLLRLGLGRNNLTELPHEMFALQELRHLNVSHNRLATVDEQLGDLVMLETLDLSHNALQRLPDAIGFLVRCTNLNANKNRLTALPGELLNMRSEYVQTGRFTDP